MLDAMPGKKVRGDYQEMASETGGWPVFYVTG